MTNIQKKFLVAFIAAVVYTILFFILRRFNIWHIFFVGLSVSALFGFLFASNNPKVVDAAVTKGQNAVK